MVFAQNLYPVSRRFIGLAKEVSPGTAVQPVFTHPMTKFTPKDDITYLRDNAWRNAMAELYNLIKGVQIADLDMEGPVFGDGLGYNLVNLFGDYWNGTPNGGTTGTPTTVATGTPYVAGASTLTVTSATGFSTGTVFVVDTGTKLEVRSATNVVGAVITLSSPMYQNHTNPAAVTPYSAPPTTYVHNFSLLNAGTGAGGSSQAQPPSYTFTDYTGVSATSGARNYAYTCLSDLEITGTANALLMWSAKGTALASAIAPSTPTASVSAVKPQAAWSTIITIASVQVNTIEEWKCTFTRKLDPKFTNSGQPDPFAIARGELGCALTLTYDPAVDESPLLEYLNNVQPTLQITSANGLSGANLVQVQINAQVAAYDTGQLEDSKTVFGYNTTVAAVANSTNAGPSGALSPASVSLTNAVLSY